MIRILHTADLHLGKEFKHLGDFGKNLRDAMKMSFTKIIDLAIEKRVDLVLIAGDLFDSNLVSSKTVNFVIQQLRRIKEIHVCIIPGTHDCYDNSSVYRRKEFDDTGPIIFRDRNSSFRKFDRLNLVVHAKANITNLGQMSPLHGIIPDKEKAFNIAMAHGAIKIEGKYNPDEYAIDIQEITNSGMNYIALGHWHRCADYSSGNTKAWYPGSPETLQFEDGSLSGYVLLISLDKNICEIERVKVGKYNWQEIDIDVSTYPTVEQLKRKILSYAGSDKVAKVDLSGLITPDNTIDFSDLNEELKGKFAFLRIESSAVHPAIPDNIDNLFLAKTVGHNFVKVLKAKMENVPPERKGILEEALRKGIALISGSLRI